MKLGKKERQARRETLALLRAKAIKSSLVPDNAGKYASASYSPLGAVSKPSVDWSYKPQRRARG